MWVLSQVRMAAVRVQERVRMADLVVIKPMMEKQEKTQCGGGELR